MKEWQSSLAMRKLDGYALSFWSPLNAAMSKPDDSQFATDGCIKDLAKRSRQGAIAANLGQVVKLLLQVVSITILARLLSPSDYGLIAIVSVLTGLLLKIKDGGLSIASIQQQQLTDQQASNLHWANVSLGVIMALVCVATAPLIASAYGDPRLFPVTAAMGCTFLISGVSTQQDALLRRQMRFRKIAAIDLIATSAGILSGIAAAYLGWRYWALVLIPIVTLTTHSIIVWSTSNWKPKSLSRGTGVRSMIRFGIGITSANLLSHLTNNLITLIFAFVGGTAQAGLFNRAMTLASLPVMQFLLPTMSVAQATLSRVLHSRDQFGAYVRAITGRVFLCAIYITATTIAASEWIISALLGKAWMGATHYYQALSLVFFAEAVIATAVTVITASGHAFALVRLRACDLVLVVVILSVSAHFGTLVLAWSFAAASVMVRAPLYTTVLKKLTSIDMHKALFSHMPIALLYAGVLAWMRALIGSEAAWTHILAFTLGSSAAYILICLCFPAGRLDLLSLFGRPATR